MTDRDERRRKASALFGGPLTPEEIAGVNVLRGVPKPPQGGHSAPLSEAIAPMSDVGAIRRAAQDGLPVMSGQVLALCERVERAERAAASFQRLATYAEARRLADKIGLEMLMDAAIAWRDAPNETTATTLLETIKELES